MRERHQPPAHGEQQPAADERRGEDDQRVAPLQVHQRGEHVLQEAALLADVFVRQVARAVLGDEARLVHAVPEHRLTGHPGDEPRQTELLRDDALPRQHVAPRLADGQERSGGGKKTTKQNPRLPRVFTRACPPARGRTGLVRSAPPLRAGTGWDGLLSPVDVRPTSRVQSRSEPARCRLQGRPENALQIKTSILKTPFTG